jgi:PKD repeat protein
VCDGCSFIGNTAETDGGGSYDTWASFCTYTANVATNDGGGACYGYLENCLIQGNVAVAGDGGGFATTVSTDWLSACTVINNTAGQNGGGCYRGDLYDCLLTNNAAQNGGAYYVPLLDANGELCRCRVWDNRATLDGGGAYGGTLYSCVLAGNSAGQNGGGLYVGSLESCTVCGNTAGEQAGGCQGGTAYNSIIYYNQAPQEVNAVDTVFTKCCTPGGFVSAQPRVAGFYWPHLLPQSPCADVGVTRAWMQEDGAGDMERDGRVLGAETDIGADEAVAAVPSGELTVRAFSETLSIAADYVQTFRAEVAGIPASLVWDFGDGSCATNRNPVDHAFASTGLYTVRVTATNSDHSVYAEIQVTVVAGAMYVATDGSHEAPFATWETAATNIQDAVDLAPFGGTVWVGDGAYGVGGRPASGRALTNRVCVSSPVAVRSLNGPSAVTINGAWQSVEAPCGPAAVRGVYLGHPEARLFGVTVSGGASSNGGGETDGGGVYSRYAASVVSNCVVSGCVAESDGGGGWGGTWLDCWLGGNLADDGGGTFGSLLTRCTVSGNQAFWYGGGAFGGRATDCEITQNEIVFGDGGGGGLAYCDALRCTVRENSSESVAGGALGGVLVNCLIYGNQAASAGGVSAADVYNCTVTENEAVTEVGGADSCNVVNSIVWGNVAPTASNAYYCTFQRSLTDPPPTEEYDLGGNLNEDPQFVNPSVDNFRLRGTSPCVDAGTNMPAVVGSTDVEGEARFYNEVIDMGAYEYAPVEGYAAMGTPVSWLEIYFAGPDWDAIELDDPDGDGFLTWQEYIAMTNPMDQGSFFAVKDVAYGEDGADVSFDTALGRVYTVQHSPGLSPVSWSNASAPVTGTGGRMTVPVPDTDAAYFYRVRVSLP